MYSLAIIMYEILAGRLPFKTESLIQISTDIINHNITPLRKAMPGLPEWTYDVVSQGLARVQNDRFQDAAQFLQALDKKEATVPERKSTMSGFPVPDGMGNEIDDDEPPALPPDVELDEMEPPDGELKETDPVYLLQPKGAEAPADHGGAGVDDLKEPLIQQGPPSVDLSGMSLPDDEAATIVAGEHHPPPGPFEPKQEVPEYANASWTLGDGSSDPTPGPLSSELTAEVNPRARMPPPSPDDGGQDTRELEQVLKRRPIWLWLLLLVSVLGVAGGALVFLLQQS